jgi:amino acid permease
LTISAIGLGIGSFGLPMRCTQVGCFWYSLSIIVGAIASYWTMAKLIESGLSVKSEEYSTTVKKIIGKIPAVILDVIIMVYLFGVIIQYDVIVYSLVGRSYFELFGDKEKYADFDFFQKEVWDLSYIKFPIIFGLTIAISPACLLKDMGKMRFVSYFGICTFIYTFLVVIIQSPWFYAEYKKNVYKEDDPSTHPNWFDLSKGFTSDFNFCTGMATVFFTYASHTGVFPIYKVLKKKTRSRINSVFFRSVLLNSIIFLLIAFCGFITDPLSTESLVVFRKSIFKNDIFMNIAKISLAIDLYLCIPTNYNCLRSSFFILFFGSDNIENGKNIILTYSVILSAAFIAAIYEDISSYLSLLGGFFCSIICFLFPGVLIVMSSGQKIFSCINIIRIIFVSILCIIGFTAAIVTIIKVFS